jgi:hypothetical protein
VRDIGRMTLGGNMPFLRASAWEGGMGDFKWRASSH